MIRIQRIERIKVDGCINAGAYTVVEGTSENFTFKGVMFQCVRKVGGGTADSMIVVILQVFSKVSDSEGVVSKRRLKVGFIFNVRCEKRADGYDGIVRRVWVV